jgi:hypothetical protein
MQAAPSSACARGGFSAETRPVLSGALSASCRLPDRRDFRCASRHRAALRRGMKERTWPAKRCYRKPPSVNSAGVVRFSSEVFAVRHYAGRDVADDPMGGNPEALPAHRGRGEAEASHRDSAGRALGYDLQHEGRFNSSGASDRPLEVLFPAGRASGRPLLRGFTQAFDYAPAWCSDVAASRSRRQSMKARSAG